MRHPALLVTPFLLLLSIVAAAAKPPTATEALGLQGPVHAINTHVQRFFETDDQSASEVLISPVQEGIHEFDREGDETRVGLIFEGKFQGLLIHRERDELGQVVKEVTTDADGKQVSENVTEYGPFGKTSLKIYQNGQLLIADKIRYDEQGRVVESQSFSKDSSSHSVTTYGSNGIKTEFRVTSSDGTTTYRYDPVNGDLSSIEKVDKEGRPLLYLTLDDEKVRTYWRRPDGSAPGERGEVNFHNKIGDNSGEIRYYMRDGGYTTVRGKSTGDRTRLPLQMAFFGEDGRRKAEANYAYDFDSHGNWTHRVVTLWTAESNQTRLYEEDTRTLIYFDER